MLFGGCSSTKVFAAVMASCIFCPAMLREVSTSRAIAADGSPPPEDGLTAGRPFSVTLNCGVVPFVPVV